MDKQKIVVIAEKTKTFAIALIGIVFVSWGTDYLKGEHLLYNIPRILLPVFNFFGAVGLAVGLLILGGGLIGYAFFKWKKTAGKPLFYWLPVVFGLAVGITVANVHFKTPKSNEKFMEEQDKQRETQIDELRHSEKPNFKNQELETHFNVFDDLYKRYEQALQNEDEEAIIKCEDDYAEWVNQLAGFAPQLNNDEKYELSRYNAKLGILWNDLRIQNREKED